MCNESQYIIKVVSPKLNRYIHISTCYYGRAKKGFFNSSSGARLPKVHFFHLQHCSLQTCKNSWAPIICEAILSTNLNFSSEFKTSLKKIPH